MIDKSIQKEHRRGVAKRIVLTALYNAHRTGNGDLARVEILDACGEEFTLNQLNLGQNDLAAAERLINAY